MTARRPRKRLGLCEDARLRASLELDGELDELGRIHLRRHLDGCRRVWPLGRGDVGAHDPPANGTGRAPAGGDTSAGRVCCRPAGAPTREEAAAEERSLQGSVSVHAAAAEAGGLTGGVEAW